MEWVAIWSAFWLGILTAISPCPLASNIAAVSFISKNVGNRWGALLSGLLYTTGRTITYAVIGCLITTGLMATGEVSRFLQKYMNDFLGPILILLGMMLLGLIGSKVSLNIGGVGLQKRAEKGGFWWALAIGVVFALSFCPISAGLFFAGLIPLAVKYSSKLILPILYGVGTALPVVIFACLIAFATEYVGKAFNRLTQIEKWIRLIAGVLFILAGIYYCFSYTFVI